VIFIVEQSNKFDLFENIKRSSLSKFSLYFTSADGLLGYRASSTLITLCRRQVRPHTIIFDYKL
jgi:hypothetical protein